METNWQKNPFPFDSLVLYRLKLPLRSPFQSVNSLRTHKEVLLLEIRSEGLSGWGECAAEPDPYYYHETIDTVILISEQFIIPKLLEKKQNCAADFNRYCDSISGHSTAKAMFESAILDIHAQIEQRSLSEMIGGSKSKVPAGISFGIHKKPSDLIAKITEGIERGYKKIRIKLSGINDLTTLKLIRDHFPDIPLEADANGSFSVADIRKITGLDQYGLTLIEQPFAGDDFNAHATLRQVIDTPICLDESICSVGDISHTIKWQSADIVNLKPGKMGGILSTINALALVKNSTLSAKCGGMLETGIGRLLNIHLQSLEGFQFTGDLAGSDHYFEEDLLTETVTPNTNGYFPVPELPGIGIQIDKDMLKRTTFWSRIFR